ncbi:FAD-binding protein [Frankia sp. CNm7]|uniref:FAD-binding protein n=1 Tax=Frankia nepalensis TaxID=1836974 RepID=A0A937RU16_9ACTN|nr:FAD-dependent oxidoreductase [Frankia nepalensis]MBL7501020.1 FAD-binding protein [Frankia nepalensis]MBL7512495.1 FAD-binding protein [Frankia nepalensis]MBL7521477.1 FAD-binding protein [Frankia nepalensis]MBL7632798.1 FAD-binding protein [Frankia nepalensis]
MSALAWDEVFDVVVVGSGAGALTSALLAADGGASVCVVEKSEFIGGTTAASGGDMWIPLNRHIADQDTREEAIAYVTRLSDGRAYDPHLIEVYVDTAAEALDYLETNTGLVTRAHKGLPDYYAVVPGRIPGTKDVPRSVSCQPYPARAELGEHWAGRVNPSPWVKPPEVAYAEEIEVVPREELLRRRREGYRAKGGGLVAPLLKALLDRGVSVRYSTPGRDLVTNEAGAVIGVVVGEDGARKRLGARKGVVLATGGFEWNPEMVKTFLGYDVKPCTPWTNTGDGHRMAMRAGAQLGLMTSFFSYGVMHDPWEIGRDGDPLPQMEMGLGAGSIIVNQQGKRFMHGGYTYNDFSHPFNFFDQRNPGFTNKAPGWCVFGAAQWESAKGVFGGRIVDGAIVGPNGQPAPSWLVAADSIRELAVKMDVDPDTLEETVLRYNAFAEKGEDPDWGDPEQVRSATGPDTTSLKPVVGPVYGAILQWPGTLGTSGGPKIDADARVLGTEVPIIDGLYAAGNTAASVLGGTYPGGGSCVGPSMVMGYRAGRHAAARPARDIG